MYELVNTSLPNGLIPGTHGFATAALTKGTPDALRMRFEALCAYKHRTGAHDATYFKENPVNWFHVVLPQGEHVVGRVAPVDFDYTGRTNRLAHLLVFPKGEMPAIGGASVLQEERNRFVAPWSGEARWLESDKQTPVRLRLEMPSKHADAPAWRAMFGAGNGLSLAKGFARQLAKNMSSGGRTIYFKTSTAHDVDGTKLLALFTDLIDLLPFTDRQKVTFATYPVALPQGTTCHLRGVYDRDRLFDAAAATQSWVDCEKGVVHNASLLPPEEKKQTVSIEKVTSTPQVSNQVWRSSGGTTVSRSPTYNQLLRKNDGTKSLFIGIIVFTVIVVLVAVAFGVYLWRKNGCPTQEVSERSKDSRKESQGSSTNTIESATQPEKDKVAQPQGHGTTDKSNEGGEAKRKEDTGKTLIRAQNVKEQSEIFEHARQREREQKEREKEDRDWNVAFTNADKIIVLEDVNSIKLKFTDREKKAMTNGLLRVFWYDKNGVLTNVPAGFIPPKNKTVREASRLMNPDPNEIVKVTSGNFLIWLDVQKNVAYWDWTPLNKKKPEAWFAKTDKIDLAELCFGSRPEVRETFDRKHGRPWRYQVERTGTSQPVSVTDDVLSMDYFDPKQNTTAISQGISEVSNKLENAYQALATVSNKLDTTLRYIQAYESKRSEFIRVESALKDKKGKMLALKKSSEEELRDEKHRLEKAIGDILESLGIKDKKVHEAQKFVDVKKSSEEEAVKQAEQRVKDLEAELSKLKNDTMNDKQWREKVRQSKFRVTKVEGYLK